MSEAIFSSIFKDYYFKLIIKKNIHKPQKNQDMSYLEVPVNKNNGMIFFPKCFL